MLQTLECVGYHQADVICGRALGQMLYSNEYRCSLRLWLLEPIIFIVVVCKTYLEISALCISTRRVKHNEEDTNSSLIRAVVSSYH